MTTDTSASSAAIPADRWPEIRALVERALDRPAAERAAFVAAESAGDPELRAAAARLIACDSEGEEELRPPDADTFARLGAPRAGPYELERVLGAGGMGVVHLGRRAGVDFDQRVAVKLIRRGLDSAEVLTRFEQERQLLADLDHPGIARLVDGGSTSEGTPYFAMEYVEGAPIDEWCDERGATTPERIELFRRVCAAVEYAHQRLVVHRDLKPGNILVDARGQPKLLDFGIAKVLDTSSESPVGEQTRAGRRRLTPAYAAPEQIRGDPITTASDVYSLGVILYRLLAGDAPYHLAGLSPTQVERVVCEEDPAPPSVVAARRGGRARELAGDLDRVVLKALRKEPERRYASAAELSEDLRRQRAGLPVRAGPETWRYRAGKFTRRHRTAVVGALGVWIALVAGWWASAAGYRAARAAGARLSGQIEVDRGRAAELEELNAELSRALATARAQGQLAEERAAELALVEERLRAEHDEAERQRARAALAVTELQAVNAELEWQRGVADRRGEDIRALAGGLLREVHAAVASVPGATRATARVVDSGRALLDEVASDPAVAQELRSELGELRKLLGLE